MAHARQASGAQASQRRGGIDGRSVAAFFLDMANPGEINFGGGIFQLHQSLDDRDGRLATGVEFGRIAHQALEGLHQIWGQRGGFEALGCRGCGGYHVVAFVAQKRREVTRQIELPGFLADGVDGRERVFGCLLGGWGLPRHPSNIELN
jgi:hypothetical protein